MPSHVLLLRSPTTPPDSDKYHEVLLSHGYHPHSVPVLETKTVNTDQLASVISSPSHDNPFHGVVMTSSRSVEAWNAALASAEFNEAEYKSIWFNIPFYVVGPKTAAQLSNIDPGHLSPDPAWIRGANETGTAEKLANYIVEDCKNRLITHLLYLSGDKNRDTLSNILTTTGTGIMLTTVNVYETSTSFTLASDIEVYVSDIRHDPVNSQDPIFVAFFAPSSSAFALPYLRQHMSFHSSNSEELVAPSDTSLLAVPVAIGPTTASYLRDEEDLQLDIVAKKPDPASLLASLSQYRKTH